jgi:hypothetical protein
MPVRIVPDPATQFREIVGRLSRFRTPRIRNMPTHFYSFTLGRFVSRKKEAVTDRLRYDPKEGF